MPKFIKKIQLFLFWTHWKIKMLGFFSLFFLLAFYLQQKKLVNGIDFFLDLIKMYDMLNILSITVFYK